MKYYHIGVVGCKADENGLKEARNMTKEAVTEYYQRLAEEKRAAEKRQAPVSIELTPLTGSEKQIAWANDIRQRIVQDLEEALTAGEDAEMLPKALSLLERVVNAHTDAKFWIDGRGIGEATPWAMMTIEKELRDAAAPID